MKKILIISSFLVLVASSAYGQSWPRFFWEQIELADTTGAIAIAGVDGNGAWSDSLRFQNSFLRIGLDTAATRAYARSVGGGGGGFTNFIIDDDGGFFPQTIDDGETILFTSTGNDGVDFTVTATNTVTAKLDFGELDTVTSFDINDHIAMRDGTTGNEMRLSESVLETWVQGLSGIGGDNLGDHTATQNVQLDTFFLSGDGDAEGIQISTTGVVTLPGSKDFVIEGLTSTNKKVEKVIQRSVSGTANSYTEIGTITFGGANGGVIELSVGTSTGGFSASAKYIIPVQYNNTQQGLGGVWLEVIPISGINKYNSERVTVDVYTSNTTNQLRLRRVGGSTASDETIHISITGNTATFTESSGTGTTTAPTNYYGNAVISQNTERVGIRNPTPSYVLDINSTDAIRVPIGTTAQRPAAGVDGLLRYNSTTLYPEMYFNLAWNQLASQTYVNNLAYWTLNGADIYRSGEVAIGKTTASYNLDVQTAATYGLQVTDGTKNLRIGEDQIWSDATIFQIGSGSYGSAMIINDGATNYSLALGNSTRPAEALVGIGDDTPDYSLDINTTDAVKLPVGTTAQRPAGTNGLIRFNTTTNRYEAYYQSPPQWTALEWWEDVSGAGTRIRFNDGTNNVYLKPDQLDTDNSTFQIGATPAGSAFYMTALTENYIISLVGNQVGIRDNTPSYVLDINSTDAIRLPVGTTAERPSTATGVFRYNTTVGNIEWYNGSGWTSPGTGTGSMDDWTLGGDSGTTVISDSETVTIQGGTNGVDISGGGTNTLTVNLDFNELATVTTVDTDDYLTLWDSTTGAEEKITSGNFDTWINSIVSGGTMDDWTLAGDGGSTVISDAETVTFAAASGLDMTYSATNTITASYDFTELSLLSAGSISSLDYLLAYDFDAADYKRVAPLNFVVPGIETGGQIVLNSVSAEPAGTKGGLFYDDDDDKVKMYSQATTAWELIPIESETEFGTVSTTTSASADVTISHSFGTVPSAAIGIAGGTTARIVLVSSMSTSQVIFKIKNADGTNYASSAIDLYYIFKK